MSEEICYYCSEIKEGEDVCIINNIPFHAQCYKKHKKDLKDEAERLERISKKEQRQSRLLLSRLKRTLKPKIYQGIDWLLKDWFIGAISIVGKDDVRGNKVTGSYFFGESSAIRTVYENIATCSYIDSSSGTVFLRLDKKRYLMVDIYG